jgi:hypothetical protein
VVEWSGARVLRGLETPGTTFLNHVVTGLPAAVPDRTFLLYSWTFRGNNTTRCCDRLLDARADGGSVTFSRGCSTDPLGDIAWERVELPPGNSVQVVPVTITDGQGTTVTVNIAPVDMTRTLVFAGGQPFSGQGTGSSNYPLDDDTGSAMARMTLTSPTTVRVERPLINDDAFFTVYVVQLRP